MRRSGKKNPQIVCGSLVYDSNRKIFLLADIQLDLTPREHAVLEALITRLGKTVSKRALVATLGTLDSDISQDAIEIYVHRLRKKLEGSDVAIVTLRGLGYLLKQRDAA